MRICICDDEINVLKEIENIIKQLDSKNLVKTFDTSEKLQKEISENNIDILFMDIKLKDNNGIDFIKKNEKYLKKTKLIYITGYSEYIEDVFETNPTYFLQKPLTEDKIKKAYKKVLDKIKNENIDIILNTTTTTMKIKLDNILYIESKGRVIEVHTASEIKDIYYKLADVELAYPNRFLRIHKSFLVNPSKIMIYKYNKIILENNEELIISRTFQKSCKKDIIAYMENNNV